MTERRVTAARKRALIDGLTEASARGQIVPGDMLPTVRELAERYELSTRTVRQELRKLVDEGLLRSVPRVGIVVVKTLAPNSDLYLMVVPPAGDQGPPRPEFLQLMQVGFEHRIADLGARSGVLRADDAAAAAADGLLDRCAGLFDASGGAPDRLAALPAAHRVWYASLLDAGERETADVDTVRFDDVGGGRQAAEHLIGLGHHVVAFLGLHGQSGAAGSFRWSRLRWQGWRAAMAAAGLSTRALTFLPEAVPRSAEDEVAAASQAAAKLVERTDVDAVVCANDRAVMGLAERLRAGRVPREEWPAMVGFDALPHARASVLTSVRPPYETLGRTAADMLWRRRAGDSPATARHEQIPMRLIARMSQDGAWPSTIAL